MKRIAPLALSGLLTLSNVAQAAYPTLFSTGQLPPNLSVTSISTVSVLNVRSFGAAGDGVTDDTAAFAAAIRQVNARLATGSPASLYIPAGVYYLNGTAPLPTFTRGGSLIGDGAHKTYIKLGPSYSGDVFSWSEAWMFNAYISTSLAVSSDQAGPSIRDLSILGSRSYTNQQNAFVFYDRDDFINMKDVQVYFLNGRGLYIGVAKNVPGHAYVRESRFSRVLFWQCGMPLVPAVEINSVGSPTDDATNELSFYGLDVIGPIGPGLVIHNANSGPGVRLIRFFGLRVEGGGPGETGDLLDIGDSTSAGNVNNVQIYGFEANGAPSGSAAVRLAASSAASQPYNILLDGTIPSSNGDGVDVNAGRQVRIHLADDYTPSGYGVTIGPQGLVGGNIEVSGDGAETGWSYKIDPTSTLAIRTPGYPLFGDPSSGIARAITVGHVADGTSTGGNVRGTAAVDLQASRAAPTQVAAGNYSAVLSGQNNAATGPGAIEVGGLGNTSSGSYGFGGGGASNVVLGTYGVIPGGLDATDRGRFGTIAFASGNFGASATGDAERVEAVLRASLASGGTAQLTSDGGSPGAANILNLTAGMAGTYSGYATVRDTVTGAMYSFFVEFGAKRPGAASTTAVMWQNITPKGGDSVLANISLSISADTTNAGIKLSAANTTSPSGNTLHIAFVPTGAEVQ